MVRVSNRYGTAKKVVFQRNVLTGIVCDIFNVSETSYCHEAKNNSENGLIVKRLERLDDNNHSWSFGLWYV